MPDNDLLTDYIFVGFVMTSPCDRQWLLQDPTDTREVALSLSPCLAKPFPGDWTLGWSDSARESFAEQAASFGCPPSQHVELCEAMNRAQQQGEIVAWHVMRTLHCVRTLRRFLPADTETLVLGLGLHRGDVDDFVAVFPGDCATGPALSDVLAGNTAFPEGGIRLGFELLVADSWSFNGHSWLCNGLDTDLSHEPDALTSYNLIASRADALARASAINRGDLGAEPGVWFPWLLVDYTGQLDAHDEGAAVANRERDST